ncbi:MAG TPA: phospho-N-acetylmuramoyl-pentapeptide-transferase, partial [Amaricoccus sp.]|nr:phospho-N-acetylmuramoyl-pentapeptide-transferase [Amaricoccus sp.]
MLYFLAELAQNLSALNVFRYITFRAGGAFMTALIFGFLFGRPLIELLRVRQGRGQPIRSDGPESHILT